MAGRNEISTLYELSRAMLMDEARDAVRVSVAKTGQILRLRHIAFFDAAANQVYGSIDGSGISHADLVRVAETGEPIWRASDSTVIPVRLGTHIVGSLALQGARLSPTTQDSIASLLAINYERVRALNRAAAAEVARRNEEFKSSLLDGLAHDLKTPLTAIRTCVTRLITTAAADGGSAAGASQHHRPGIGAAAAFHQRSHRTGENRIAGTASASRDDSLSPISPAARSKKRGMKTPARYSIDIPPDLELDIDAGLVRRALDAIAGKCPQVCAARFADRNSGANPG